MENSRLENVAPNTGANEIVNENQKTNLLGFRMRPKSGSPIFQTLQMFCIRSFAMWLRGMYFFPVPRMPFAAHI